MTIVLPPELENSNDCHLCTGIPFRAFRRILCGFGFGLDLLVHILLLHLNSEHVKFHHNQMVPQINSMETKKTKQKQPQKKTMLPCYNVGWLLHLFCSILQIWTILHHLQCHGLGLGLQECHLDILALGFGFSLSWEIWSSNQLTNHPNESRTFAFACQAQHVGSFQKHIGVTLLRLCDFSDLCCFCPSISLRTHDILHIAPYLSSARIFQSLSHHNSEPFKTSNGSIGSHNGF